MGTPSSLSIVDPNAVERLKGAMPIERVHTWSASPIEQTGLVVALQSGDAANPSGWPQWLSVSASVLYGLEVGGRNEQEAADFWGYRLAQILQLHVNYGGAVIEFVRGMLRKSVEHDVTGMAARLETVLKECQAGREVGIERDSIRSWAKARWEEYSRAAHEYDTVQGDIYFMIDCAARLDVSGVMASVIDMRMDLVLGRPSEGGMGGARMRATRELRELLLDTLKTNMRASGRESVGLVGVDEWNDFYAEQASEC